MFNRPSLTSFVCFVVQGPGEGSYSGYDIVLIAGQSNAVGNSHTDDPAHDLDDATPNLPVYFLAFGVDRAAGWYNADTDQPKYYYDAATSNAMLTPLIHANEQGQFSTNMWSTGSGSASHAFSLAWLVWLRLTLG